MNEKRRFKLFAIRGSGMDQKLDLEWALISERFVRFCESSESWWFDRDLKYGFVKPIRTSESVVCSITQEYILDKHLYDESKNESRELEPSFEDRVVLIDFARGIVALEWRKFVARPPLDSILLVRRLTKMLTDFLRNEISSGVYLNKISFRTSKQQFLQLFYEKRILGATITKVGAQSIPSEIVLVNPVKGLENATRALFRHDRQHASVGKITASATPDGDLKRSAIIRGAIHSGEPKQLTYQEHSGMIKIRSKTEKGEITVELPVFERDSIRARTLLAATVVEALQSRDILPTNNRNLDLFLDAL